VLRKDKLFVTIIKMNTALWVWVSIHNAFSQFRFVIAHYADLTKHATDKGKRAKMRAFESQSIDNAPKTHTVNGAV